MIGADANKLLIKKKTNQLSIFVLNEKKKQRKKKKTSKKKLFVWKQKQQQKKTPHKMYCVNDDEDDLGNEVSVEVKQQLQNAQQIEDLSKYVAAHNASQIATKTKKMCKERIEQEMQKQKQKVITVDDHFFVRDEKVSRVALTLPFVKQGFLSFLRKRKNTGVSDQDGDEFVKYLEEERERHAMAKKPVVKYCKKRPPETYF